MWNVRKIVDYYGKELVIRHGKSSKSHLSALKSAKRLENAMVFYWNKPVDIIRNGVKIL